MTKTKTEPLLLQTGSDWTIRRAKGLQQTLESAGWVLEHEPSLQMIEQIDLCGLQLLVKLHRRTSLKQGRCHFRDVPDVVRDAARSSGLDRWLEIDEGESA